MEAGGRSGQPRRDGAVRPRARRAGAPDGLARQMAEDGEPEEALAEVPIPEPFEDWLFASFFPGNMLVLYQRWLDRLADRPA